MSNRQYRLAQLKTLLEDQQPRRIDDLADQFGVCNMTIRRDAELLARDGTVQLLHGAVVWCCGEGAGLAGEFHSSHAPAVSEAGVANIARAAAALVRSCDTVTLDSGLLPEALAVSLDSACSATFITYSHNVFLALQQLPSARIILAGGEYAREGVFHGIGTTGLLQSVRSGTAFLSAEGVSLELGVTCRQAFEYELKRALMEYSINRVLLAPHSCFGHTESTCFAALDEFTTIVSDKALPDLIAAHCRQHGVKVLVADGVQ